jgi:hypothetical protein
MKAISIKQPWAWAIVHGYKPVENRTWRTTHRGELAVHASRNFDKEGYQWLLDHAKEVGINMLDIPTPKQFVLGAVIGTVEITDCVRESTSPWFFGPVGFLLTNAIAFKTPIPCKGRLSIFSVDIQNH